MMTKFRNSLTWRDTIEYAVSVYDFIIRGKGLLTGKQFSNAIKAYYNCEGLRMQVILSEIEKHIVSINATYKGTSYKIA